MSLGSIIVCPLLLTVADDSLGILFEELLEYNDL